MDATMARARGDRAGGRRGRGGRSAPSARPGTSGRSGSPRKRRAAEAEDGRADPGALRRRAATTRSRRRRSGAPGWSRASRWPTTPGWSTSARLFLGQWGLRGARGGNGPSLRGAGRDRGPAAAAVLAGPAGHRGRAAGAAVVYGYFPAVAEGDDAGGARRAAAGRGGAVPASPSPASAATGTCAWPTSGGPASWPSPHGEVDVLPLHLVTMGQPIADYANELFAKDAYRDYLEVHGLGVQLTEALAEYWHRRIREELTFPTGSGRGRGPRRRRGVLRARLPRRALLAGLRRLPEPRRPRRRSSTCCSPAASA